MIKVIATRGLCAMAIAAAGLIATAAPAAAGTSLNPAPPSWYTCRATGSRTTCHGTISFEWFADFDGTCPQGFNILENAHKDETGRPGWRRHRPVRVHRSPRPARAQGSRQA
jgi:hypothetical protein